MNARVPAIYGARGEALALGPQIGRGGEGAVYRLSTHDAAKIYTELPDRVRVEKLEALVRASTPELSRIAAWPTALLRDSRRTVIGFAMPRIENRVSLAIAMNPGSRKARFPQANWAWLAHVAQNLASAIEMVHRSGVVLGDLNDSNFLVGDDSLVRIIDIDSFQVRYYARVLTCDVGVPTYQPPELQGKSFAGLRRGVEHDRFGLAVLIFQLLFMGRHPWAGVRGGPEIAFDTGEIIAKLPFAFGSDAARAGFRPPPNSVRMDWLTPAAGKAFERAFSGAPLSRPTAAEWASTLAEFEGELGVCAASPAHRFIRANGPCPWCDLERRGIFLFVTGESTKSGAVAYLDIAAIEARIAELPPLEMLPVPEDPRHLHATGAPLPPGLGAKRFAWRSVAMLGVAAAGVFALHAHGVAQELPADIVGGLVMLRLRPSTASIRRVRQTALEAAEHAFADACAEWMAAADMRGFLNEREQLKAKLAAYRKLPAKFTSERAALEHDKARHQLRAYLASYLIADARIEGIGRKRRETLAAYGIETALDVEEVLPSVDVPGIGGMKRAILAMWANALRSRFRFDPNRALDPALHNELYARESRERSALERDLRGGPQALRVAIESAVARREALRPKLAHTARVLAQAAADLRVVEGF